MMKTTKLMTMQFLMLMLIKINDLLKYVLKFEMSFLTCDHHIDYYLLFHLKLVIFISI
jgi:hypothetical protein